MASGAQSAETFAASSSYQTSRPAVIATAAPVRLTTITLATTGARASASSQLAFSGTVLPPRRPSSLVMTMRLSQSVMRWARLSGAKPPNTTECTAPMRAQASMA